MIPLCLTEQQTPSVAALLKDDQHMVVWWGTSVECYSALARLRREGHLTQEAEDQAGKVLHVLAEAWTEVEPTEQLRQAADRLLRLHPLRAGDALQLAAALVWAERAPRGHVCVCLDSKLRQAAHLEGFALLPVEL